jgi:L-lactate permease
MEKNGPKMPDEKLGKFFIFVGCAMMIVALFPSRSDLGPRLPAITGAFIGLSWGLQQVAGAKKWRQKYGEPSREELAEIKASHSVSNLPILLGYLVLGIIVLAVLGFIFVPIFHYQGGAQLKHPNPP